MRINVVEGDITVQGVDAVVNAANSSLMGGGGVDGAIHRAAGPQLLGHCRKVRDQEWPDGLPPGEAAVTPAGDLPAKYVIHTVGPNRHAGETDPDVLASCFRQSLAKAAEVGAESVAFPAVGAGVYGWPAEEVAEAAYQTIFGEATGVEQWAGIEEIRFVLFNAEVAEVFRERFRD